jgi:hypothetical protein
MVGMIANNLGLDYKDDRVWDTKVLVAKW